MRTKDFARARGIGNGPAYRAIKYALAKQGKVGSLRNTARGRTLTPEDIRLADVLLKQRRPWGTTREPRVSEDQRLSALREEWIETWKASALDPSMKAFILGAILLTVTTEAADFGEMPEEAFVVIALRNESRDESGNLIGFAAWLQETFGPWEVEE